MRRIRANALWGCDSKRVSLLAAFVSALLVAAAPPTAAGSPGFAAEVPAGLLAQAQANPDDTFAVVVQGTGRKNSDAVASDVAAEGAAKGLKRRFDSISGVSADLTGRQILKLATKKDVLAITDDAPVALTSYWNDGTWPYVANVDNFWPGKNNNLAVANAPTIAVVDSGVDASNSALVGRVIKQVTMTALTPNSPGDGRGHGTFVASIAAGAGNGKAGASPTSKIVSLDVADDRGMAMTSDVIAAADWIVQNKDAYGIRVANFSLHSSLSSSFMYDPLDKAVEKLWLSGVVVVAAAGNYAVNGAPSGVLYAPANDPFVITVGATDQTDNEPAPWSAFGYTNDGFSKPDLSAPGRMFVGSVPATSTMPLERPDRVVGAGLMRMSGTSFAAPVVSGAAAVLLARHPNWTPDQVKGALMLTARLVTTGGFNPWANGVGMIDAKAAAVVADPPNPNVALEEFVAADPSGGTVPSFDSAAWASAAWSSAAWGSAAWGSAAWSSAAWSSAAWASAAWSSAAWGSAAWGSAAWGSAAWGDSTWVD
jgi:serine protease AprX